MVYELIKLMVPALNWINDMGENVVSFMFWDPTKDD